MPWISSTELWRLKQGQYDARLIHDALASLQQAFVNLNQKVNTMSQVIDRLTASVTNLTTVDDSLVALVTNLAQTIRDNATDPKALNDLADKLDAESAKVSEAVTANTPAEQP